MTHLSGQIREPEVSNSDTIRPGFRLATAYDSFNTRGDSPGCVPAEEACQPEQSTGSAEYRDCYGFSCEFSPRINADGVVMVGLYAPGGASD